MRFTPKNRAQRAATAGVVALTVLGASGCSAVNEQATTREYSPSDGIVANVGDLQLRNILVVSNGSGEEGRLIGTVINDSDQDMDIELVVGGSTLTWSIPEGGKVVYEQEPAEAVTVETVEVEAGTGIDAELTAGSENTILNVPVVNGDLESYRQYLPTPTPSASESATSAPSDTATDTERDTGAETGTEPTEAETQESNG